MVVGGSQRNITGNIQRVSWNYFHRNKQLPMKISYILVNKIGSKFFEVSYFNILKLIKALESKLLRFKKINSFCSWDTIIENSRDSPCSLGYYFHNKFPGILQTRCLNKFCMNSLKIFSRHCSALKSRSVGCYLFYLFWPLPFLPYL